MIKAGKIASGYLTRERCRLVPVRRLGKTNLRVKAFGLGGQALLEQENSQKEAYDLINKAIRLGVNYLDTATIYGPSRYYLGRSIKGYKGLVINTKVRDRSYNGAKKELDEAFRLLQVPYIDIVQLHAIEGEKDKRALRMDGALQVLKDAKAAGKIGFIGFSGHNNPDILMDFMDEYDFDTMLIAINPTIPYFDEAVKKAESLDMGVISMKVMSRGVLTKAFPADKLLHYAMQRSDVAIVGCSTESDVERNVLAAADYKEGENLEFNLTPEIIEKSTYFVKGHDPCKWPSTYQPNWPELQFD